MGAIPTAIDPEKKAEIWEQTSAYRHWTRPLGNHNDTSFRLILPKDPLRECGRSLDSPGDVDIQWLDDEQVMILDFSGDGDGDE